VLFDTGPPEARVARLLRRAGVRRLSALVLTHASRDHHGGAAEVIRRFPVDLLVDGGDGSPDRTFRSAVRSAAHRGVRRVAGLAPSSLRAGGISIRVLAPRPRPPGPAPEDPNPRGMITVVSAAGFDLLLSADAESPSLLPLALPQVDAMKVPHHGSADPGLPDVLRRLRPRVAGIEVGRHNTYGHPAPGTVQALRASGVRVYRTDVNGTIRLTPGPRGLTVATDR
jgi:competence protein ComEC